MECVGNEKSDFSVDLFCDYLVEQYGGELKGNGYRSVCLHNGDEQLLYSARFRLYWKLMGVGLEYFVDVGEPEEEDFDIDVQAEIESYRVSRLWKD